jgi:hypothetical protein
MSAMGHSMRFGDIRPTKERDGMPNRELRTRHQQESAQCVRRQENSHSTMIARRTMAGRTHAHHARDVQRTGQQRARTGTRRRGSRSAAGTLRTRSSGRRRTCPRPPLSCVTNGQPEIMAQHIVSSASRQLSRAPTDSKLAIPKTRKRRPYSFLRRRTPTHGSDSNE